MNQNLKLFLIIVWGFSLITAAGANRFDAPPTQETPTSKITVDAETRPSVSEGDDLQSVPQETEFSDPVSPSHPDVSPEVTVTDTTAETPTNDVAEEFGLDYRDPFWPLGYVPKRLRTVRSLTTPTREPHPNPLVPNWDEARKRLDIRGVSRVSSGRGRPEARYLGMVNGRWVEAGDVISVRYEGFVYRWQVRSIDAQGLKLIKLNVTSEAED